MDQGDAGPLGAGDAGRPRYSIEGGEGAAVPPSPVPAPSSGGTRVIGRGPVGRLLHRAWHALPIALAVLAAVAALVRLTARDRFAALAWIHYASPPCLLSAALFVAGLIWFLRRSVRASLLALVGAVACQVWWAGGAFLLNPPPADDRVPPRAIRGMLWNVRRGADGWDAVAAQIRQVDPDVVWLVEANAPEGESPWLGDLHGYESRPLGDGLVAVARGQILETRPFPLGERGHAVALRFLVKDQAFSAVLLDLPSNPFHSRRPAFDALDAELRAMRDAPAIVAGDFNTPRDSALLEPLRGQYRHAFEVAGRGYDATWPLPLPCVAIDQVWVGAGVKLHACRQLWPAASDHRPVVVEFLLPE